MTRRKSNLIMWNTILWIVAMALPACFRIAFDSTKFPWPIILPLLLVGPMLASNRMISNSFGNSPTVES
jgi:hypothetical protein